MRRMYDENQIEKIAASGGGGPVMIEITSPSALNSSAPDLTLTEQQGALIKANFPNVLIKVVYNNNASYIFTPGNAATSTYGTYNFYMVMSTLNPVELWRITWMPYNGLTFTFNKAIAKTIFGNTPLFSSTKQNINLYRHVVKADKPDGAECHFYFTVISSKDALINSLANVKNYLGNTFTYPCSGIMFDETGSGAFTSFFEFTQDNAETVMGDVIPLSSFTFTDTVATV